MGSDRARISYDKRRRYRGVVSQQGRVTLEADQNEDRLIGTELLREETLDIVGRSGTPDDGFAVTQAADPFDIAVGAGTMYVGGERVELASDAVYSRQGEWLDHVGDPDWLEPDRARGQKELVYLYLEEHEVSAVEDTALLEVALGGPDSAQRLRLLQRIRRRTTGQSTCEAAMAELVDALGADGLRRDPNTQQLISPAALKVVYEDQGAAGTLCEPETQGGYLGAENQLIRIQTAGPDSSGNPTLVWGFDDASFLYRVQVGADRLTLTLASSPVDDHHKPAKGQAVEVLRAAAALETGTDTTVETSPDDFVAAATGSLRTLAAGYDSTTKQVVLDLDQGGQPLDPAYADPNETPVVFLRVWQEQLTFTPGQPVKLGDTGVSVVLDPGGLAFHAGEYWQVAVRPKTPTEVYPVRYLEADPADTGEPPGGPRRWICPLAVIEWNNGTLTTLEDCRNRFDNLVELSKRKGSGCCDIVVRPEDLRGDTTLQSIVDRFKRTGATICLAPGRYSLKTPLMLGPDHSGLTIEACHGGAVLQAEPGTEPEFYDGLVVLVHANDVTLRGVHFRLPQVPLVPPRSRAANRTVGMVPQVFSSRLQRTNVSIGVRPLHCARLTIESCQFRFTLTQGQDVFAAGIFAGSECWGFTAHGNWFLHDEDYMHEPGMARVLIGYLLSPSNIEEKAGAGRGATSRTGITGFIPTLLDDASFRANHFSGLSAAALIYSDCGLVEIQDNTVRLCEFGFVFFSLRSWASGVLAKDALGAKTMPAAQMALSSIAAISEDPVLALASLHARSYRIPSWATKLPQIAVPKAALKPAEALKPITAMAATANTAFAAHQPDALPAAQPRARTSVDLAQGEIAKLVPAQAQLAAGERTVLASLPRGPGLALSLHFADNDIDLRGQSAQPGAALVEPGPGLFVWDVDSETGSSLTMDGNRIATATPMAAVFVLLVERCAIAANVIENGGAMRSVSIWIQPLAADANGDRTLAVTGNSFAGRIVVPLRGGGYASPLDQWDVFNAITM